MLYKLRVLWIHIYALLLTYICLNNHILFPPSSFLWFLDRLKTCEKYDNQEEKCLHQRGACFIDRESCLGTGTKPLNIPYIVIRGCRLSFLVSSVFFRVLSTAPWPSLPIPALLSCLLRFPPFLFHSDSRSELGLWLSCPWGWKRTRIEGTLRKSRDGSVSYLILQWHCRKIANRSHSHNFSS